VVIPKIWFKDRLALKKIPTMTEVVAVALIAPDRRVLMQRRAVGRQHGGLWEFPGGKVETGETLECALIREIAEELALVLYPERLTQLAAAEDTAAGIVITLYTCREWHGTPACLDAEALGWFAPDELDALAMPPLDVPLARAVKQLLEEAN
jgi:8-oxo-dGTP diphosphatase